MFPYNTQINIDMMHDLRICRKCGVLFDVEIRKNKDCPVCHGGEHTHIRAL